ncbi:hypothetical protein NIES4102_15720 [Chondrocystis sp. NIES-4102]|nr:hypothetical protein NIES4102_15720 [Chondrocystis sp. NIES-4102]
MRIELTSIHFQNWKCFQKQSINFDLSTIGSKNIWVVFGDNGYGKTSLLQGILWCLYGVKAIYPDTRQQPKFVTFFNSIAVDNNPNLEMSVTLTFKQDKKNYRITRVAKRLVRGNTISYQQSSLIFSQDGKEKSDVTENIESLLPESCKELFFFDGKKIEEYAKLTHSQETRDAIERVLGIPEIRNLITDIKNVRKEIEKELGDTSIARNDLRKINQELNELQDIVNITEVTKNQTLQELQQEYVILQALKNEARQSDEAESKFGEINSLEKKASNLHKDLEQTLEKIKNAFRQAPVHLLSKLITQVTDETQTKTLISNKQLADVSLLEKLIVHDSCVCGRCIDSETRRYLEKQLEEAKNSRRLYEQAVNSQKLHTELSILCRTPPLNLELLLLQRDRLEEDIADLEQAINKLKLDTDGFDRESVKKIWQKMYQQENVVKQKKDKIERLEKEIEEFRQQESRLQRQRQKLASQNKEAASLSRQSDLACRLYQATDELVRWQIDNSREIIEKHTSEIHQRITNKPEEYKGVKINDDYTLGIKLKSNDIVNPEAINFSPGEKEALAFSFIAGLNQASGKAAPLVMDTPFGHLDPTHKKNIINSLPELPSQVILLATGEDLPQNILEDLAPYIAETHIISRKGDNEFSSVINVQE